MHRNPPDRFIPVRLLFGLLFLFSFTALGGCSTWQSYMGKLRSSSQTEPSSSAFDWQDDWQQALSMARQQDRLLLVDFTGSDWCIWCQRLDEQVFSTERFAEWAGSRFVGVRLDYPQTRELPPALAEQNAALRQQYAAFVKAFPTVLVVTPQGDVVAKIGYVQGGPDAWITELEKKLSR